MIGIYWGFIVVSLLAILQVKIILYLTKRFACIPAHGIGLCWLFLLVHFLIFPFLFYNGRYPMRFLSWFLFVLWLLGCIYTILFRFLCHKENYFFHPSTRPYFRFCCSIVYGIQIIYWFHPTIKKATLEYLKYIILIEDKEVVKKFERNERIAYALSLQAKQSKMNTILGAYYMRERMKNVLQEKNMNGIRYLIVVLICLLQVLPSIWVICMLRGVIC